MSINIINVTDKITLDKLYDDSALTVEGITEESIPEFVDSIFVHTTFKKDDEIVYIIKGKVMNEAYNLTGNNAYPDDLTIASIMLSDLNNPMGVVTLKFEGGTRWFDDIVDNNEIRERENKQDIDGFDECDECDEPCFGDDENRNCNDCPDDECTGHCLSCSYRPV